MQAVIYSDAQYFSSEQTFLHPSVRLHGVKCSVSVGWAAWSAGCWESGRSTSLTSPEWGAWTRCQLWGAWLGTPRSDPPAQGPHTFWLYTESSSQSPDQCGPRQNIGTCTHRKHELVGCLLSHPPSPVDVYALLHSRLCWAPHWVTSHCCIPTNFLRQWNNIFPKNLNFWQCGVCVNIIYNMIHNFVKLFSRLKDNGSSVVENSCFVKMWHIQK